MLADEDAVEPHRREIVDGPETEQVNYLYIRELARARAIGSCAGTTPSQCSGASP